MSMTGDLIRAALAEDVGTGDVTSEFFLPPDARGAGVIVAREAGVLAGSEVAGAVFRAADPALAIAPRARDGDQLSAGEVVMRVVGRTASILGGERTALNFLQRLSGIATLTRRFVDAVSGTGAVILDTRKTTPGWRELEKAAVRAGGGRNHRHGLFDMIMVKDNHLSAQHGRDDLQRAIDRARAARPDLRIEIEADRLEQVRAFLGLRGIDVILLDNMALPILREAVALAHARTPRPALEASGGVNLNSVRAIAETGVDFISCGALTHSAPALDLALDFTRDPLP